MRDTLNPSCALGAWNLASLTLHDVARSCCSIDVPSAPLHLFLRTSCCCMDTLRSFFNWGLNLLYEYLFNTFGHFHAFIVTVYKFERQFNSVRYPFMDVSPYFQFIDVAGSSAFIHHGYVPPF